MPRIDAFLKIMQQSGASDLHLGDGYSPFLRVHGILESTQHRVFTPEEVKILFFEMLTDARIRELEDAGEIDFMYELPEVARFRTPAIGNLIRESKTQQIGNALVTGRALGMQKLEHHLRDLVSRKIINQEEAALFAENPQEFLVARKDAPAEKLPPPRTP
ncbi:MAG: hypothetical protein WC978_07365 [bacterium]